MATSSLFDAFTNLLPVIEGDLNQVLTSPATYPPLFYQMMHYHMGWVDEEGRAVETDRGKRVRPVLTLVVSEAVCGSYQPARPAAAAVELMHNFSLLHDDIQDGSPTRRGRPAAWTIWGSEQAINAGDAMFALSYLAIPRLASAEADPRILYQLTSTLGETAVELTRGQHLDMMFEERSGVSGNDYLDMISGKTAALIAASAEMGAIAAGADDEQRQLYREFGHNVGMAFQALDDVLDIWGDTKLTGKKAAVDIYDRKKSLPVLYALERSDDLHEIYDADEPMSDERVKQAIALLDSVGARSYAEQIARQYSEATIAALETISPSGEAGKVLYEMVDYLLKRNH